VGQDLDAAVANAKRFVEGLNGALDKLAAALAYNADTKAAGTLTGDSLAQQVQRRIRQLISYRATGLGGALQTLADVGISTGAVGAKPGSATRFQLDEARLRAALQGNPNAVADVLGAYSATATLSGAGGSLASVSGAPTADHRSGRWEITADGAGELSAVFTPTGGAPQTAITGSIAAGGTNSTLIAGLTLTARGTLGAGVQTIDVDVSARGVLHPLEDYLRGLTNATGALAAREDEHDRQITRLDKTIEQMEERLERKRATLEAKFARMEVALAKLQSQSGSLEAQITQMSARAPK
jgi:flagellar hook-associated protein 2